jgi:hypothetical protein
MKVEWPDKMSTDPAFFVLYAFMFFIFSILLFLIVICCKYAIFESKEKTENLLKSKEDTAFLLTEQNITQPKTYAVYQQN